VQQAVLILNAMIITLIGQWQFLRHPHPSMPSAEAMRGAMLAIGLSVIVLCAAIRRGGWVALGWWGGSLSGMSVLWSVAGGRIGAVWLGGGAALAAFVWSSARHGPQKT
jgi:hypothetical protein